MSISGHPEYAFWKYEENTTICIRQAVENNLNLDDELKKLEGKYRNSRHGTKAKEVIAEALKSKNIGDGYNVIMHAASLGNFRSLSTAIEVVKERLGRSGLVTQLRESDIHGAPLTFQAAGSSDAECFKLVCSTIRDTLGSSELRQQLQAKDLKERSIIFHAAKGKTVDVLKAVIESLNADRGRYPRHMKEGERKEEEGNHPSKYWLLADDAPETLTLEPNKKRVTEICGKKVFVDYKGMTVLHVACRWSCSAIVEMVLAEAVKVDKAMEENDEKQEHNFTKELLRFVDKTDRTPLMQALRRSIDGECAPDISNVKVVFNALLKNETPVSEMMKLFTQPASEIKSSALMHAAYGGRLREYRAYVRFLQEPVQRASAPDPCHDDGIVSLDFALGIEDEDHEKKIERYGILLAAAASGGHSYVLEEVFYAVKTGKLQPCGDCEALRQENNKPDPDGRVQEAIRSVNVSGGTLLTVAMSSRVIKVVTRVVELIKLHLSESPSKADTNGTAAVPPPPPETAPDEAAAGEATADEGEKKLFQVWDVLRGHEGRDGISNLAFAASMPDLPAEQGVGKEVFDVVYGALEEAAKDARCEDQLRGLFMIPVSETDSQGERAMQTPLARSFLSRNQDMFKAVFETFDKLSPGTSWTRREVLKQIPTQTNFGQQNTNPLYLAASRSAVLDNGIPPTMLFAMAEAIGKAKPAEDEIGRREEDFLTSQRLQRLVQAAAELGNFDLFRSSPFYHQTIPCLLERIGDYEENIIDAVMLAVISARNPFVMSAVASRYIDKAESDLPMHRIGLRRLQEKMDALGLEILNELPHTVRGVGLVFGAHDSVLLKLKRNPATQKKHERLAAKLGFVVLQWILEPSTVQERALSRPNGENMRQEVASRPAWLPSWEMEGPEFINPLQWALERGSRALDFVNTPLVLDYMLLKFSETVPPWTSRNPFSYNVGEKFYTHSRRDSKDPYVMFKEIEPTDLKPADLLLRFLQGWDVGEEAKTLMLRAFSIPHETILPGLQFTLAGIIGAPATYYEVPAIRFSYELLGYIALAGLFCSCVKIADPTAIPINEIFFYVSVLGLMWREILEFGEVLPAIRVLPSDRDPAFLEKASSRHITATLNRYFFQDAWNILDTSTIVIAAAAFTFRMIALHQYERDASLGGDARTGGTDTSLLEEHGPFFLAQTFLAVGAIPLFARILSLSQIENTLGPMTQIIWTMLSHLWKFSVYLAVVMASFALAFHMIFQACDKDSILDEAYGTFADAYLTMFRAMLGDFYFAYFEGADECQRPPWAESVGVSLLVLYLAIMSILLLNLLIAVLSTAHDEASK